MKTITKKEAMYQRIKKHGDNLNVIFHTEIDPIKLCKRLRQLENTAHYYAEAYCNGEINEAEFDAKSADCLKLVRKVLNIKNVHPMSPDDSWPVVFNSDARGYALKIHDSYVREHSLDIYKDWGGYGILAPDLTND